MIKTVFKIDGMKCGMCESHVNDVVRNAVDAKKVTSSHSKGETVVITENEIDEAAVSEAIGKQGYRVISVSHEPYVKKGIFSVFRK